MVHSATPLLLGFGLLGRVQGLSCLDNDGRPVDWSFTYKLPDGYNIAYFDANSRASGNTNVLPLFERSLADRSNPVAVIRTLNSLTSDTHYMFYNDQPDGKSVGSNYGHSKGVVGISDSGAFWLLHSTPHFPGLGLGEQYVFPEKETTYGQTFLCMSVPMEAVNDIAGNFLFTTPYVYFNNIPDQLLAQLPNLAQVIAKKWQRTPGTNFVKFSAGSTAMTHFAKNGKWGQDIYEDLIAPGVDANLMVESWMRGEELGSYCQPKYSYTVLDVNALAACCGPRGNNITWTETQDHSKWGITLDSSNTLCISDINRMTSQRKRGGGTVCFKNSALRNILYNSITSSADCD